MGFEYSIIDSASEVARSQQIIDLAFNLPSSSYNCSYQWCSRYQWQNGFYNTIEELIMQMHNAYALFPPRSIDFLFLTLLVQCCLDDILGTYGDNDYSIIQQMGKDALFCTNADLPTRIAANASALETFNEFD